MTAKSSYERMADWFERVGAGELVDRTIPLVPLVSEYCKLKHEAFDLPLKTVGNVDINKFNPLSKVTAGNPWTQQYENQNRMNEIKLDVDRTFQDMAFFKSHGTQTSLINILFVFGKANNLLYRQGMNEICAICLFVVNEGVDAMQDLPGDESPGDVKEAVTYSMFSGIMLKAGLVDFFFAHSVLEKPGSQSQGNKPSPLLVRCENTFDLLCQKDARLHKHLVMNDISPNLFLLRWMRLLFSREFSFGNTLGIWDHIFSSFEPAKLLSFPSTIDYVAIAMLLSIKPALLASDNSGCFTLLLKYPEPASLSHLLQLARSVQLGEPLVGNISPQVAVVPQTRRDRVVTDLSSVIEDLRNSQVSKSIQKEIAKLEDLVSFLKPPK
jgi:TBC1 domain family protein 5